MAMSLTQLQAFVASANEGSFTAAARELQMTQPAVSDLVRRLEEELNAPLFVRGPRKITLTPAGEALLPHATQTVGSAAQAAASVHALNELEGGKASFGLLRNADYYLLSDLVKNFHQLHPRVAIRLVGQNSAETIASVVNGELEAGLVVLYGAPDSVQFEVLARDEIVHVAPPETDLPGNISIEEFLDRPLILYDSSHHTTDPTKRQLNDRAHSIGREVAATIEVERVETALDLVRSGIGETFVCRAVTNSPQFPMNLVVRPFDPPLYDLIALVKRKELALSPATRELSRLAAHTLRKHAEIGSGTWEMMGKTAFDSGNNR